MTQKVKVAITVNGTLYEREVEPRLLLSDFIRHDLGLKGTHVGCEHGLCGAVQGWLMADCSLLNMFAGMVDGSVIKTVESLGTLENMHHSGGVFVWMLYNAVFVLGFLMTTVEFLEGTQNLTMKKLAKVLMETLWCTGYKNIVKAVLLGQEDGCV